MGLGALYFAAVADDEIFDEDVHNVEDLLVFNVKIGQSESEFAKASLEVLNPREGLLLDSRKQRIFISCEESPGGPIVLLFSGRITGFPVDLDAEVVTLEYLAQAQDWQEVQAAFLETLKVDPYYNPLFIPPESRDDAAEILAARSAIIHWHRATGAISISDILEGSEIIDVAGNFFFDSVDTTISDPPLKTVNLSIEAQWEQIGVGDVDVGESIRLAFNNTTGPTPQINSLTPDSFEQGWNGVNAPRGYEITEKAIYATANSFGLSSDVLRSGNATVDGTAYRTAQGLDTGGNRLCTVPRVWFKGRLKLLATYRQKRTETLNVLLNSQSQEYSLAGDSEETIFLRMEDPVAAVNGAVLDPALPSFFIDLETGEFTSFGLQAAQHGILRARARLAKAMRAVETSFELPLDAVLDLTCDHTIHIADDRLPGTQVFGKVLGYSFEVDGDSGRQVARVTIGSCIGLGFDSNGPLGAEFFEDVEYETLNFPGTMTSAVYYSNITEDISEPIDVAQMESDSSYLIDGVDVENSGQDQNNGFVASSTPDIYLQDNKTRVVVDLKSMNPEPQLDATIGATIQFITWPKQIDLGTTVYNLATEDGDDLITEDGDEIIV